MATVALKGWCTWHNTWLQMMILGPLSRVMMVRQPFWAKNMQTSHFLCAKFSPARPVLYLQPHRALLWSNRTAQWLNTTAGLQKLCHCSCSETIAPQVFRNYGTAHWFYRTVWSHSFCTPAVVLNRWAVLLDHNNARYSCKYRTARAGLNFAHKKVWSLHVFCCTKWLSDHQHSTQGAQHHHLKPCLMSSAPSL